MKSIIDLQAIDGSWEATDSLMAFISGKGGLSVKSPPEKFAPSLKGDVRVKAWATVVALWLLESFCGDKKNEWKRIAVKGSKFLKGLGVVSKEALALI